jgi:LPXTG-site transpeptidase (sortase) family protein
VPAVPGTHRRAAARLLLAALAVSMVAGTGWWAAGGSRTAHAQTASVFSLAALKAAAGEDPKASYGRIRIPSLGVDAAISARGVSEDAPVMPDPYGPGDVVWYDFEVSAFGGAPGAGRNAVLSGHVNYNANVGYAGLRYAGPGVFADLDDLRPGDIVEVVRGSKTYRYAVSWLRTVDEEASNTWGRMISADTPIDSLTLFTCDGLFDAATRTYSHRIVVRAELLEGKANRFPAPVAGKFTIGVSGTTHPEALIAAQRWPVDAVYARHAITNEWLVYRQGAPAFANTLLGHLRQDSFVIIQLR